MTYSGWFDTHAAKHRVIMEKLADLSDEEVIAYFRYDNMVEKEPDFCPLYATAARCHDLPELNCYLCACPHFRFSDRGMGIEGGKTRYSACAIGAVGGETFQTDTRIHHDCSRCVIPHDEATIRTVFRRDWKKIMKASPLD